MARLSPRISLVVPVLNQKGTIAETIQSLLAQEGCDLEIIVIDGGSTDGTFEYLKSQSHRFAHFISGPDKGQSDAINRGFDLASGDILGWLCGDDRLENGALRYVASALPIDRPAWLLGRARAADAIGNTIKIMDARPITRARVDLWWHLDFAQPSVFWNRKMMEQVGPVRIDLHYTMDYELWTRMIRVTQPIVTDRLLSFSRLHPQAKSSQALHGGTELLRVQRELLDRCWQDEGVAHEMSLSAVEQGWRLFWQELRKCSWFATGRFLQALLDFGWKLQIAALLKIGMGMRKTK